MRKLSVSQILESMIANIMKTLLWNVYFHGEIAASVGEKKGV